MNRMKFKKRFLVLNILIVLTLLSSVIVVLSVGREYTIEFPYYSEVPDISCLQTTYDHDRLETTGYWTEGNSLYVTVRAKEQGEDFLTVSFTDDPSGERGMNCYAPFYVGYTGIIFDLGAFSFSGHQFVSAAIYLCLALTGAVMLYTFIEYLLKARFSYSMIACGGVGLFCMVQVVVLGALLFLNPMDKFLYFASLLVNVGKIYLILTAPLMLILLGAVSLSNSSLIRHEGFRVTNLLGIIFSLLWIGGIVSMFFFDENSSGSYDHARVFSSISTVFMFLVCYFETLLMVTAFCAFRASRHRPPYDRDYLIILGCAIRDDGSLTPLLQARADSALQFEKQQFAKTGRHAFFVPSGGQGDDEVISESEAIKRYLMEQGIPEEQILMENKSVNTMQNLAFSKRVIEEHCGGKPYQAAFSTTNYHVFRGYILAARNDLKAQGISARTKWYFFPNAFLREFVGLLAAEKFKHLFMMAVLLVVLIGLGLLLFV